MTVHVRGPGETGGPPPADDMLKAIWGKSDQSTARAMDVHLTRLRKHLSMDDSIVLQNVHGSGFILSDRND